MFRHVMTVLISLLAMVFLTLLLMRLAGGDLPELPGLFPEAPRDVVGGPGGAIVPVQEGTGVGEGKNRFIKRGSDGMPRHMLEVEMTPVRGTGRFDLKDPLMVFYHANGDRLYVQAPEGYIDSMGRFPQSIDDIRMGELSGGVRVWRDRGTAGVADDVVFSTDKLLYDQERGRLETSDAVTVVSPEGTVRAVGMVILMDTATNEIREVQLVRQVRMELQGRDLEIGLFGEGEPVSSSSGAAGEGLQAGDKSKQPMLYEFEFVDSVRATQGDKQLHADRLVLLSRMKGASQSADADSSGGGGGGAFADPEALSREASAAAAASRSGGRAGGASAVDGGAVAEPILVHCEGSMFIRPKPDAPSEQGLHVTATGRTVRIVDRTMTAECRTLTYDGATQIGVLDSVPAESDDLGAMPVMVRQGGSELVGPRVLLDRVRQQLHVDGAGRLRGVGSRSGIAFGSEDRDTAVAAAGGDGGDGGEALNATWSQGMRADFGSQSVLQADGSKKDELYLKEARFIGRSGEPAVVSRGDELMSGELIEASLVSGASGRQGMSRLKGVGSVVMRRPKVDEERMFGDLSADRLEMTFRQTAAGDSEPSTLQASGAVEIRSPEYDIAAGELAANFLPGLKDGDAVRLNEVVARRDVRVKREGFDATADVLESRGNGEHVKLTGNREKLAEVVMDENRFLGEVIDVYQQVKGQERVNITGRGEIHVLADLSRSGEGGGASGAEAGEPVPISVEWLRKMSFDGHPEKNVAQFSGTVSARLPDTRLQSHDLWLFFSDKAPAAGASGADGGRSVAGLVDPSESLRGRKEFERLVAVGSVIGTRTVDGRRGEAAAGEAVAAANVQELTLRSGKLEHDARSGRSGVDGAGRVTIHEYRPEAVRDADRVPVSTTDVQWQGKMVYDSERLVLLFSKDVVARVDGREMKVAGASPMSVQSGSLRTQDLRIFLQPGEGRAAGVASGGAGLFGSGKFELKHLIASQQTSFTNENFTGSCDRLTYDAGRELVVLDGRKGELAEIWQRTADGSRDNRQAGERIMYWVQQGRAVVTGPEIDARPSGVR